MRYEGLEALAKINERDSENFLSRTAAAAVIILSLWWLLGG